MGYHTGSLREVEVTLPKAEARAKIEELVERFAYNL
jgi:hypothetical protein